MPSNHPKDWWNEWLALPDGRRVLVMVEDPFKNFEDDILETSQRLRSVLEEMERCALDHVRTVRAEFEKSLGSLVALRADDPEMRELNGEIIAVQVRPKGFVPEEVDLDALDAGQAVPELLMT